MTHIHWCSVEQNEWVCWWRWHLCHVQSAPFSVLSFTQVSWLHPSNSPMGRHIFNDNCFVCVVKKAHSIKFTILTTFKSTVSCLVSESCPTLCDLVDGSPHQAPLSMEFPRQEYWSGLPFPPPGDLSNPGSNQVCYFCCVGIRVLYQWPGTTRRQVLSGNLWKGAQLDLSPVRPVLASDLHNWKGL